MVAFLQLLPLDKNTNQKNSATRICNWDNSSNIILVFSMEIKFYL